MIVDLALLRSLIAGAPAEGAAFSVTRDHLVKLERELIKGRRARVELAGRKVFDRALAKRTAARKPI